MHFRQRAACPKVCLRLPNSTFVPLIAPTRKAHTHKTPLHAQFPRRIHSRDPRIMEEPIGDNNPNIRTKCSLRRPTNNGDGACRAAAVRRAPRTATFALVLPLLLVLVQLMTATATATTMTPASDQQQQQSQPLQQQHVLDIAADGKSHHADAERTARSAARYVRIDRTQSHYVRTGLSVRNAIR